MKMNALETWMMVNPIREAIQWHYAAPKLRRLGGVMAGGRALEIGCGHGEGVEIILDQFRADRVDAFDLDPDMVFRAHRKLRDRSDQVRVWTGSVTDIDAPDDFYDAVFGFGVIHHLPNWRAGVAEVARVLKPGGLFYTEESFRSFICHPVWRRLLHHPQEDRFDPAEYTAALEAVGFRMVGEEIMSGEGVAWMVAELRGAPVSGAAPAATDEEE